MMMRPSSLHSYLSSMPLLSDISWHLSVVLCFALDRARRAATFLPGRRNHCVSVVDDYTDAQGPLFGPSCGAELSVNRVLKRG